MKCLSLFFVLFVLVGCGSLEKRPSRDIQVTPSLIAHLPAPAAFLPEAEISQLLQAKYKTKSYSVQIVLKRKGGMLSMVGVSEWGTTLFLAEFDGKSLRVDRSIFIGDQFSAEYALLDLVLTYAPLELLNKSVIPGAKTVDGPLKREVYFDGKKIIEITYSDRDRLKAKVRFNNVFRDYGLTITTLSVKRL